MKSRPLALHYNLLLRPLYIPTIFFDKRIMLIFLAFLAKKLTPCVHHKVNSMRSSWDECIVFGFLPKMPKMNAKFTLNLWGHGVARTAYRALRWRRRRRRNDSLLPTTLLPFSPRQVEPDLPGKFKLRPSCKGGYVVHADPHGLSLCRWRHLKLFRTYEGRGRGRGWCTPRPKQSTLLSNASTFCTSRSNP